MKKEKNLNWIKCGSSENQYQVEFHTSSCQAASTDSPDSMSPAVSIVHRSQEVIQATSCIGTELLKIGFSWSSYFCSSMWRGPQEYIANELVLTSLALSRMSGSSNLYSFRDGWLVALQLLFCWVLPPRLVQYNSQPSCIIAVKLILHTFC